MTELARNCCGAVDKTAVRAQLDRILTSSQFRQSPRLRRFLDYVVMEVIAERGDRLKGYAVALEVFDRPASFDPVADPIVRIEASRLRMKLQDYYDCCGRDDPILIEIPKGTYTPRIVFRQSGLRNSLPTPSDPAGACAPASSASDALLRGLKTFWRYSRQDCAVAQNHFRMAVDLEPDYALAHAWLARTYVWQAEMRWVSGSGTASAIELANRHSRCAAALNKRLALAHSVQGRVHLCLKDKESAVRAAQRACMLDPNSAEPKMILALVLSSAGRGEEALSFIETAMLLQPHPSSFFFETLGLSHLAMANYEHAIVAFQRGIAINPSFVPCHYDLAVAYGACGRTEEARAEAAIVKADWPDVSAEFIADPALADVYERGKHVAGLT